MSLNTENEKTSYALGINMGAQVSQLPLDVDVQALLDGVRDMLEGNDVKLPRQECISLLDKLFKSMESQHGHHCGGHCHHGEGHDCGHDGCGGCHHGDDEETLKAGEAFRAEHAKKDGVKVLPSGLQIEITVPGDKRRPKATDTVKVHYTGRLIDGTVFDSSVQRGTPLEFPLNQVIAGWTEGMQLLGVGGKATLVIPPELGYGEMGAGDVIPPNATLVFDVELLGIR